MTENDLYYELLEMADNNKVRYSLTSSARKSVEEDRLDEFRQQTNQVKMILAEMRDNNTRVLDLRDKLIYNTSPTFEKETNEQIYGFTQLNSQGIATLKRLLEQIGKLIDQEKVAHPDEPQTMSKIYQKNFLVKQIDAVVRETQKIQVLYDKWSVGTVTKRIMLLDNEVSQKQAEQIARQNNGYEKFLMQKTMGKASLKLKYRVDDIMEKHEQIKKLQKSIAENLVMMQQIAFLVHQQGELIDSIEQNVLQAKDYIQKGTEILHKQKQIHQKGRKKICCAILIAIIILALIAVPIIVTKVKSTS